ncbi:peptidoglycan DD-metalloendopeptidase family protein [Alloalcanivorax gelatiniphagus]|nr:peptidoglycan DD-metalloendopeptidase family protein [Alloalcanivorax gelatiniphagus]|tara:strand:- start:7117 stop:7872 length:756 start_codon:yes stop_codon:yes gene_type:complete
MALTGCAVSSPPPVVDIYQQDQRAGKVTSGSHRVQRGETLYSIAWRYGWDYRSLARANSIGAPYTIYPGQVISFAGASPRETTPERGTASSSSRAPSSAGASSSSSRSSSAATPPPPPKTSSPAATGPVNWQWPASGKLLERYSSAAGGRRGIAIGGREGSPVVAAAGGRVVYRGSGLTGYGNLLIIKHNDRWLSAYAHNKKLLVKEGDQVRAGQEIATMGASGTLHTQLHFEIRKDGQPVDPLALLPRKS